MRSYRISKTLIVQNRFQWANNQNGETISFEGGPMLKVRFLFASLMFFVSQGAYADGHEAFIVGTGSAQCGKVLNDLEANPAMRDELIHWMHGFLSAYNSERFHQGLPILNLEDNQGQYLWLIDWCKENPLGLVWAGVAFLYQELVTTHFLDSD